MLRLIVVASAAIGLILFVAFIVARLLRTRTRGMSIRMQVFLALGLIVGTFAFGLGLMVIDRIEARAVYIAKQAAEDEAAALAGMMAGDIDRSAVSIRVIAERLQQEHKRGADLRLELLDADGVTLFPAEGSSKSEAGVVHFDSPIVVRGVRVGAVRVVKPTVVMRNLLTDFAPTVLVISLILGAAAALAAAWIGREIAAPIESLSQFGERVSAGERTAAPIAQGREVMRLARAIDSMRRQLEGRPFVETFASDLSHELKNPVAAIRASAEVLEESALEDTAEARRFVLRIRQAAERIERLLNELLSLARIESRGAENFEPVDLAQLTRRAIATIAEGSARITLKSDGDTRVRGEPGWLSRALVNLIDNALVHSEAEGSIDLELSRETRGVTLTISSPGSVAKHVRTQLFRRFVTTRADKGGTGLGLSIVRAVAEAHGGYAELVEPGPPRVVFRLMLPPAHRSAADRLRDAVSTARDELSGDEPRLESEN